MNTIKTLKKVWLIAEWHTRPIIVDCHDRLATVSANFDQDADTRLTPVLKRIIYQIKEHLLDTESVGFHPWRMLRHIDLNFRRDLVNARIQAVDYPLNAFPDVDQLKIQARFSRFQLGKREKIFDQDVKPLRMFVHRLKEPSVCLGITSAVD